MQLYPAGAIHKPNSVSGTGYPVPDGGHSSMDGSCPPSLATYPEARTGRPHTLPYLVLHRVGFAELLRSPGELVRSYRTVSPLPRMCGAVCFLLHFPSRFHDSTLWSTLPCGVRTFLRLHGQTGGRLYRSDRTCLTGSFLALIPVDDSLAVGTKLQFITSL